MSHTMFVPIDVNEVQKAEYDIFQTHWDHNFGLDVLFEVESENEDRGIVGLDHLRKALIAVRLYNVLSGFKWRNIIDIIYDADQCGANVEFESVQDAMLFKLANGGAA